MFENWQKLVSTEKLYVLFLRISLIQEVCKCLDTWLQQGIIGPLQSPYASQLVIV